MKGSGSLVIFGALSAVPLFDLLQYSGKSPRFFSHRAKGPYTEMVDGMRGEKIMRYEKGRYRMVAVRRETKNKTLNRMRR